jgi:hypothetical protein
MFRTECVNSSTITLKHPKPDNVLINAIAIVTTHSQQPKQHVLKGQEPIKAKGTIDQQKEECLHDSFVEIMTTTT